MVNTQDFDHKGFGGRVQVDQQSGFYSMATDASGNATYDLTFPAEFSEQPKVFVGVYNSDYANTYARNVDSTSAILYATGGTASSKVYLNWEAHAPQMNR